MQNKLFRRLIATFVLITVSIPNITLAGDHQPQTWIQSCSQAFITILDKDYFDGEQQAEAPQNDFEVSIAYLMLVF